jgi:hypothetical protein
MGFNGPNTGFNISKKYMFWSSLYLTFKTKKMIDLFYEGGVLFMSILSLLAISSIVAMVLNSTKKVNLNPVKELGYLALVIGILGQLIGLYGGFQALAGMTAEVSTAIIFGGLKISMISALYGMLIFAVTRIYVLISIKWITK